VRKTRRNHDQSHSHWPLAQITHLSVEALRIYADEFRDRRTQAAEEMGAKIGTKLIFPLIFCLWPSFFLVAIGPALIGVIKAFG